MRNSESVELMGQALELLVTALSLIDESDAPAEIGAYIDMARDRLSKALGAAAALDPVLWGAIPRPAA